ncbi:MAG: PH domain-containing protein [Idiomarina sp.]|nr:PH domain-containing protein [Idiomarina sp.]
MMPDTDNIHMEDALADLEYLHVNPRYITQLRIDAGINWGLLLVVALVISYFLPTPWLWLSLGVAALIGIILVIMLSFWAPRRYRLTGYLVRDRDVLYRTGALWRKQTAVPVNRIQHVEITQGPIERMLGLARLIIYTAGGSGSDLAVPGLPAAEAERLRAQVLHMVAALSSSEHIEDRASE